MVHIVEVQTGDKEYSFSNIFGSKKDAYKYMKELRSNGYRRDKNEKYTPSNPMRYCYYTMDYYSHDHIRY